MKLNVRVIRTYHVEVEAEYGDTEDTLREKGLQRLHKNAKPDTEDAVLLPEGVEV